MAPNKFQWCGCHFYETCTIRFVCVASQHCAQVWEKCTLTVVSRVTTFWWVTWHEPRGASRDASVPAINCCLRMARAWKRMSVAASTTTSFTRRATPILSTAQSRRLFVYNKYIRVEFGLLFVRVWTTTTTTTKWHKSSFQLSVVNPNPKLSFCLIKKDTCNPVSQSRTRSKYM